MIYLYLFGTCFHFIYVFMIIGKYMKSPADKKYPRGFLHIEFSSCLLVAFESIDIASEIGCEDHVAVC